MTTLWQDIRYAMRMLVKSPGFTVVVVLVLALGIGANTAIFSVINGILLKSLPVRDPQDLRVIGWRRGENIEIDGLTSDSLAQRGFGESFCMAFPYPLYRQFVEKAEEFSSVFGFSYPEGGVTVSGAGFAVATHGLTVSGNFFAGYGARVLIGRPITPEDDRAGAEPVAVITYPFWRRHYDLDPHVLGQTLLVNSTACTIVGVLPKRYRGPLSGDPSEFYVPLTAQPQITSDEDLLERPTRGWVRIMGRLAPGANEARARGSLEVLFRQVVRPAEAGRERSFIVLAEAKQGLGALSSTVSMVVLIFLQALVGVVLLIACANVASLLLAQGPRRHHEMSVRAALGAGRWRLIRQSLVESLVLSLGAAALGLVLSAWINAAVRGPVTALLRRTQAELLDYMGNPSANVHLAQGIDGRVLLFALAVGMLTTVLAGLIPALRAAHVDPSAGLKASGGRGAPRPRLGKMMIVVQVALSMVLVTGAGLLTRTIVNLYRVDPGFEAENLLVFQLTPLERDHASRDLVGFFDDVRRTLAAIPGVRSVALSHVEGGWYTGISIRGRPPEGPEVPICIVSDGWLATKGVPLLAGRDFAPTDIAGSRPVAIANEAFARRFFPGEYPLGQLLKTELGDEDYELVGLCGNHKLRLGGEVSPILYVCTRQEGHRRMTFTVRSVLPPLSLVPAVRRAVAQIDPAIPLEGVTTQELQLKESVVLERTLALLCVSLALLGLGLSCLGLYGLMSYGVARRTGEIGIRMALGARPADVARPILREAGLLALLGIVLGLPLTLLLAAVLSAVIFGIAPYDPATLLASGLILLAVAVAAAWLPARRAAKIDPMVALRYE
jgi:predicted permease